MAGLIEVGILKPDLGNALAAGYQGAERARMQNQQAQLQSQQAQQELETGKLNLEQLKQDRVLMLQLQQQLRDAGRDPDLNKVFDALISTGKPDYVMKGLEGKQRLKAQQDFDSVIRGMMPGVAEQPPAPTNALAPSQPAMPAAQPPANALVRPPAASAAPAAPAVPVNALVPTPQQPVNALGGSQRVAELQRQIMALSASSDPRAKPMIEMLQAQLRQETTPQRATVPGVGLVNARTGEVITAEQRTSKMLTPEEEAQRRRLAEAGRSPPQPREPAVRTTKVELADGSIGVMNLDTGAVTPATVGGQPAKGKLSAFAEKAAAQREQLSKDIATSIRELTDATSKGGLIDQSTGSGAGRLIDVGARFVGKALPGDIAIGKLKPIADLPLKLIPRFEGPQSNQDTASYKEAAGQLADPTLPNEIRKAAGKTVLRLLKERRNQFGTSDMAAEGVGGTPRAPATGVDASNPLLNQ